VPRRARDIAGMAAVSRAKVALNYEEDFDQALRIAPLDAVLRQLISILLPKPDALCVQLLRDAC
jgi:hypothetical protein